MVSLFPGIIVLLVVINSVIITNVIMIIFVDSENISFEANLLR
jgi:hypothetical protein